jgi:hypothetical protein
MSVRRVILVEGVSDRAALLALAGRQGRQLDDEGVSIVAMGGAMNLGRFLAEFGAAQSGLSLGGLCDAAEEPVFGRYLTAAGFGTDLTRERLEELGFFVCVADLEEELIRALGAEGVERVIASQGELAVFRTFQNQPHQRGRPIEQQLHRFVGTIGGRKERYARACVEHLDPDAVPRPIRLALATR